MSDNSPEFFEKLANGSPGHLGANIRNALRSAAALARENAELCQWKQLHAGDTKSLLSEVEQMQQARDEAESSNRALQAEVDRLNRAVDRKNFELAEIATFTRMEKRSLRDQELRSIREAIAYTGTDPQEKGK